MAERVPICAIRGLLMLGAIALLCSSCRKEDGGSGGGAHVGQAQRSADAGTARAAVDAASADAAAVDAGPACDWMQRQASTDAIAVRTVTVRLKNATDRPLYLGTDAPIDNCSCDDPFSVFDGSTRISMSDSCSWCAFRCSVVIASGAGICEVNCKRPAVRLLAPGSAYEASWVAQRGVLYTLPPSCGAKPGDHTCGWVEPVPNGTYRVEAHAWSDVVACKHGSTDCDGEDAGVDANLAQTQLGGHELTATGTIELGKDQSVDVVFN